jgi:hypothetical protein
MEHTEIVSVPDTCESPVYLETSPVSSPVIISKNSDHEWITQVTDKLILPELNELDIRGVVEASDSKPSDVSKVSNLPSIDNNIPVKFPSEASHGTEMVTIVIKDFTYCKEEFLKKINENNVSISTETIMRLLRMAMIVVEQTNESGSKKKEFAIKLLEEVVMSNDIMTMEDKLVAINMIKGGVVSDAIDFLIDATRGKFDVNKVEKIAEEVAKSCFAVCFEKFLKKK